MFDKVIIDNVILKCVPATEDCSGCYFIEDNKPNCPVSKYSGDLLCMIGKQCQFIKED